MTMDIEKDSRLHLLFARAFEEAAEEILLHAGQMQHDDHVSGYRIAMKRQRDSCMRSRRLRESGKA